METDFNEYLRRIDALYEQIERECRQSVESDEEMPAEMRTAILAIADAAHKATYDPAFEEAVDEANTAQHTCELEMIVADAEQFDGVRAEHCGDCVYVYDSVSHRALGPFYDWDHYCRRSGITRERAAREVA